MNPVNKPMMSCRSERGQSVSVFSLLVTGALILLAGLVIAGGQQAAAASSAEVAAADAARVGADAMGAHQLIGADGAVAGRLAAQNHLATAGVDGEVRIDQGRVYVHTTVRRPTLMLSIIRIDYVTGEGEAWAETFPTS